MDPKWYGAIDLAFVFAPVLAFAAWELWSLRRDKRRREAEAARAEGQKGEA
ncbi:MAG: hypothetical protein NW215_04465 [Hyphomicrobiales bacterium]|nr:hypothetical protein [Hyphomicrobiales bacterium]